MQQKEVASAQTTCHLLAQAFDLVGWRAQMPLANRLCIIARITMARITIMGVERSGPV